MDSHALMLRHFFCMIALLTSFALPMKAAQGQERCELPAGYLDQVNLDLEHYGTAIAAIDVEDSAALAAFFIELYQVRQRYEDMTLALPDCSLRVHLYLLNILSAMQDTVGLAMAIHTNPAAEADYIAQLSLINARLTLLAPQLRTEITIIERPPALSIRFITAEAVNVRAAPGAENPSLGVLERGAEIEVIALDLDRANNSWYNIYYGAESGWVLAELTSSNPP